MSLLPTLTLLLCLILGLTGTGFAKKPPVDDGPWDYTVEVSRTGLNKLFVVVSQVIVARQRVTGGPLESLSVTMDPDTTVLIEGVTKLKGLGRVAFRMKGNVVIPEPDRLDFLVDGIRLDAVGTNVPKELSLSVARILMLQLLGLFVKNEAVTDYLDVDTRGFVPVLGSIGSFFGVKRAFEFVLKPEAFPTEVVNGLHAVRGSNDGELLVIRGRLD